MSMKTIAAAAVLAGLGAPLALAQEASPSRIGMGAAVAAALAEVPGGVLEAELERERGGLVYEIEIAGTETLHEVVVDAATGKVVSAETRAIEGMWRGWFASERFEAARGASGRLAQFIAAAEERGGGSAKELSLDEENGRLYYEFELLAPTGEVDVAVDLATGEVLLGDVD
ncbi:PepSY domain-containing protein [Acuticoccus mangrovi]|uniref:PepSY domain-containing protein n=1 Tax=Acuticoccus mangrovi TaxID=2796142 RepID=A0A934IMD1_9HYPH|nr:PepSY domain-containing protein [Acuticoccus mangrovi]MBJ3774555.1 PepSY domain-containing protein [Acuticoccus mangrovi]